MIPTHTPVEFSLTYFAELNGLPPCIYAAIHHLCQHRHAHGAQDLTDALLACKLALELFGKSQGIRFFMSCSFDWHIIPSVFIHNNGITGHEAKIIRALCSVQQNGREGLQRATVLLNELIATEYPSPPPA